MAKKTIWLLASIITLVIAICFVIFYFFFKKQTSQSPITGNTSTPVSNSDGLISELKTSLLTKISEVTTQINSLTNDVSSISEEVDGIGENVSSITTEVSNIKDTVGTIHIQVGTPVHRRFNLSQDQARLTLDGIDPAKILDIERNGLTMDSETEFTLESNVLVMFIPADEGEFIEVEYTI